MIPQCPAPSATKSMLSPYEVMFHNTCPSMVSEPVGITPKTLPSVLHFFTVILALGLEVELGSFTLKDPAVVTPRTTSLATAV